MKGRSLNRHNSFLSHLLILGTLSCGINGDDTSGGKMLEEEAQEGSYKVVLRPINPGIIEAKGMGVIHIKDNVFFVKLAMKGLLPNTISRQHIHLRNKCPDQAFDTNHDEVIDEVEAFNPLGEILLSLNSNLNIHDFGRNHYPVSDAAGKYVYQQQAVLSSVQQGMTYPFNLSNRALVVYGLPSQIELPSSVSNFGAEAVHASVPVACGKIRLITLTDHLPGPPHRVPRTPPVARQPDIGPLPPPTNHPPESELPVENPPPVNTTPVEPAPNENRLPGPGEDPYEDDEDDEDYDELRVLLEDVVGGIDFRSRRTSNYGDEGN
jgi:hypothetical protein